MGSVVSGIQETAFRVRRFLALPSNTGGELLRRAHHRAGVNMKPKHEE
jgi:hypothetical protein